MKRRKPEEPKPAEEKKDEPPKERPKFTGSLKNILNRQTEDNAEANKNIPELQKKLQEEIKIHDPKPVHVEKKENVGQTEHKEENDEDEFD